MGSLSVERARQLLGGDQPVAGRANRQGLTLLTLERRGWPWRRRDPNRRAERQVRPGSRLIATGAVLLFFLGSGLLAVSYAAQYAYVLHERGQHVASVIEAGALDVGMIIFALLAMGLARAGKPAKIERAAVVVCAAGSALMNFAPAEASDWRSVLAWTMPPIFLAFVVDRTVRTLQRHVLGEDEGRSPWAAFGFAVRRLARFTALAVLYSLRFGIDRTGTWTGVRQAIINATPLPAPPAIDIYARATARPCARAGLSGLPPPLPEPTPAAAAVFATGDRAGSKKAVLLSLYCQHEGYGDRARVSRIAAELAPQAGLQAGTARTYLGEALRQIGKDAR